ncbi:hypothetical protein JW758_02880 [Candidatus Peregrinibacteria bacterium]|nr:hypothetical protein [Candidatus Peregrinibacteria bacterium]
MNQIDFVGTSHVDQEAEGRIQKAFEVLKPNVITLEYPSDQRGYIDFLNSSEWRKRIRAIEMGSSPEEAITSSSDQPTIKYGSEITALQRIYEETETPLYCVDSLRAKIKMLMSSYAVEMAEELREMDTNGTEDETRDMYTLFGEHFQENGNKRKIGNLLRIYKKRLILTRYREISQRNRIRKILNISPYEPIRLMHVGGLAHLADIKGFSTLYSLSKKVFPPSSFKINRHTLNEFD